MYGSPNVHTSGVVDCETIMPQNLSIGHLIQSVYRHHRKRLFDCPRIGHRLEERVDGDLEVLVARDEAQRAQIAKQSAENAAAGQPEPKREVVPVYEIAPHPDFNFKVGDVVLRLPGGDPAAAEGGGLPRRGAGPGWPKPRESRQWRWDGDRSTSDSDERGVWRSRHSPWATTNPCPCHVPGIRAPGGGGGVPRGCQPYLLLCLWQHGSP